jgi:hypothetical protein
MLAVDTDALVILSELSAGVLPRGLVTALLGFVAMYFAVLEIGSAAVYGF